MRAEIGIANLQTDELASAGFEGVDTIGEGNGRRLTNKLKLLVKVHGNFLRLSFGIITPHLSLRGGYRPTKQSSAKLGIASLRFARNDGMT
jgi:hypothetical protein